MAVWLVVILLMTALTAAAPAADDGVHVATAGPDGVQRVEVVAGSYFFRPARIVVRAAVPVELAVRNESLLVPHNFVIDAPEAGMDISMPLSERLTVIRFVPGQPGKYRFFCDRKLLFFKSHREKGMEGIIEARLP